APVLARVRPVRQGAAVVADAVIGTGDACQPACRWIDPEAGDRGLGVARVGGVVSDDERLAVGRDDRVPRAVEDARVLAAGGAVLAGSILGDAAGGPAGLRQLAVGGDVEDRDRARVETRQVGVLAVRRDREVARPAAAADVLAG